MTMVLCVRPSARELCAGIAFDQSQQIDYMLQHAMCKGHAEWAAVAGWCQIVCAALHKLKCSWIEFE